MKISMTSVSFLGVALTAAWLLAPAAAAEKPRWNTAPSRTSQASAPTMTAAAPSAHVAEILREPESFRDKQVTLRGAFRGWKGNCKWSAMISRSDWMLDDKTGCIYVNGQIPAGLSPQKPSGEQVTVSGKVQIREGKPVLRMQKIDLPKRPATKPTTTK